MPDTPPATACRNCHSGAVSGAPSTQDDDAGVTARVQAPAIAALITGNDVLGPPSVCGPRCTPPSSSSATPSCRTHHRRRRHRGCRSCAAPGGSFMPDSPPATTCRNCHSCVVPGAPSTQDDGAGVVARGQPPAIPSCRTHHRRRHAGVAALVQPLSTTPVRLTTTTGAVTHVQPSAHPPCKTTYWGCRPCMVPGAPSTVESAGNTIMPGLGYMHRLTRRNPLRRHLHHRRCSGKAPLHHEVSFVAVLPVHGGAMGWPGLDGMVRSTSWRRDGTRQVTVTCRNFGGRDIIRLGPGHA